MATDFGLAIMLITVVFILGLASFRMAILGIFGVIIGILTLFDLASTGSVIMGYAYNMGGEIPILEQIVETSAPLQMLSLVVIVIALGLTLGSILKVMSD